MIHEFDVKVQIATKDDVSRERAEEILIELIDHSMIYSIGRDCVSDNGYPRIFDYDIEEVDE